MAMLNNQMGKICKHIWSTRLHMKTCRKSKKLSVQQRWMIPRRRRSYTDHHWLSWRNKMQQWNIHCCCNIVVNRPAKICVCIYMYNVYIYIYYSIYIIHIYTYIYIGSSSGTLLLRLLGLLRSRKTFLHLRIQIGPVPLFVLGRTWKTPHGMRWSAPLSFPERQHVDQTLFDTLWLFSIANYRPGRWKSRIHDDLLLFRMVIFHRKPLSLPEGSSDTHCILVLCL